MPTEPTYLTLLRQAAAHQGVDIDALAAAGPVSHPCSFSETRVEVRGRGERLEAVEPDVSPCPRCRGGLYEQRVEGWVPCRGSRLQTQARLINAARIPAEFAEAVPPNTEIREVIHDVVRDGWRVGDRGWWLYGKTGRGKSWALAAAARVATAKGVSVLWASMPDVVLAITSSWGDRKVTEMSILEPLRRAPLLILDEVGGTVSESKGRRTLHNVEIKALASIIDARWRSTRTTTWLASNLKPDELEALGDWQLERTFSRLRAANRMHEPLHVEGRDRRRA